MQLILVGVLIIYSFLAEAAKTELRIPEFSTVKWNDSVRLGTIVEGDFQDIELMRKIFDIVVLPATSKDEVQSITSEQIALVLRQKLSFQDLQRVSLKIPEVVRLKPMRNFIYPQDIRRVIFETAYSQCQCEVKIEELKIPVIKGNDEILEMKLDNSAQHGAGSILVGVTMFTSKGKAQYWATAKTSFYKEAPVAKRLLQAGERVSKEDFEMKVVNVSFAKDGVPTSTDVLNRQVTRMITVGQPLFFSDLRRVPAAERGQTVKMIVGSENFEVSSQGVAQDTGFIGDLIKVKNADTQKVMTGVLFEKGVVKLQ